MAQDDLDDAEDSATEAVPEAKEDESGKLVAKAKQMTLILSTAALFLGLAGGAAGGYLASGYLNGGAEAHGEHGAVAHVDEKKGPSSYVPLPKMQVNLASARCRGLFLRLELTAEVGEEAVAATRAAQGVIVDGITSFIRSQTKEDLDGRDGTEKFRANVAAIVNDAIQPHQARNVLFKDFLLQ
jgi:flagellar basal body-associated protein FliL